ncbi:hypothetical protein OHB26_25495 [Nocardia sp. NBC_01503]|uniref:hypothetical protein n=1 Tax=Nocardia sp. NBC_01503 TaxID=2975997 RepID=UPI002E7B6BA5|nr:hypothetical protein [Nocardia sp. NBC_01503]WTL30284.1 hypothetical protein OHB26_25495 [Nocardia sp. NBC_01503]
MPEFTAITPSALAALVANRANELSGFAVIAVDGADAAEPVRFAESVVELLRTTGRPAEVVAVHDFVRPASVRLEFDREDEYTYRTGWFDYSALNREVLKPLRDSGRWLPALWNEQTDRSARARIHTALPGTILLIAGPMLLGRGLDFDFTIGLRMSEGALRRRTAAEARFTIAPVLEQQELQSPDLLVAWDHPDRPAIRG